MVIFFKTRMKIFQGVIAPLITCRFRFSALIQNMRIGIPREIKEHEYRVALTPRAVVELAAAGHDVVLETGAGQGSGASDQDYVRAGARIASDAAEVYGDGGLIIKVKEPLPGEFRFIGPEHVVFTFFHFASDPVLVQAMKKSGAACVAYETMRTADGRLPLLEPMSEIAGRLAVQEGARHLETHAGGSGILMGGVSGAASARVLVIGGGIVGTAVARVALGMGGQVLVLDVNANRLTELEHELPGVETRLSESDTIGSIIGEFDLVIGAVLVQGARTPRLISRSMLKSMRPGSVIVDVGIDQGGCLETGRPTSWKEPVYKVDGILHFCVPNLPGAVPRTSAPALSARVLPWARVLAKSGWREATLSRREIASGLNIARGEITHGAVARAFAESPQGKDMTALIQKSRISA